MNDLFGVREAKGLEFDACALVGFLGYMEDRGSGEEWVNALRWLSSSTTLANTDSTGEVVNGVMLADCDYRLSAPNVSVSVCIQVTCKWLSLVPEINLCVPTTPYFPPTCRTRRWCCTRRSQEPEINVRD